jgi:putative transposase
MQKLGTGFTSYINSKYNRTGVLFQGKYKAVEIKPEGRLIYLAGYVNCNSEIYGIERADKWIWSSYLDLLGERNGDLCEKKEIMNLFDDKKMVASLFEEAVRDAKSIKDDQKKYLME